MIEPAVPDAYPVSVDVLTRHNTQRLIALGEVRPDDLVAALAWDALALIPAAALVVVRLRRPGERARELRLPRPALAHDLQPCDEEALPPISVTIRAAQGRVGSISLWPQRDMTFQPADEFAAVALSWLGATAIDRLALYRAERQWRREKGRLDATFSAAPVGIAHVAPDGSFLAVNERFAAITRRSRDQLLARGFQTITHPDDLESDMIHVGELLNGTADRYMMEKRYLLPDGDVVWVNLTVALIRDDEGQPDYFVSVIEDLSDVKRAHAAATHDPLTGLLNRRGLMETLPDDVARCAAAQRPLTVLYIDFDDFKSINDRYGHARGDACLIAAAAALAEVVGSRGRIARIGGDELVITLPGADVVDGKAHARRLRDALTRVHIDDGWTLSASIGRATASGARPMSAHALIDAADRAMFRQKHGRSAA